MSRKLTEEEIHNLVECFESLDVVPSMDTSDDVTDWIRDLTRGQQRMQDDEGQTQSPESKPAVTTQFLPTPKISIFTGEGDQKDAAFESWHYEVQTLLREGSYSECTITTAAKKSLRGDAAKVARRLGITATIREILNKLRVIYGRIDDTSDLLTEFHKATQGTTESVSSWCCRIEELLFRALEDGATQITQPEETIRLKFYSGLHQDIKDRIRHLKGHLHSLDSLLFEARRAEMEGKMLEGDKPKKAAKVMKVTTDEHPDIAAMKMDISQLHKKVDQLTTTLQSMSAIHPPLTRTMNSSQSRGSQYWNQGQHQHQQYVQDPYLNNSRIKPQSRDSRSGNYFHTQHKGTARKPESNQHYSNQDYGNRRLTHSSFDPEFPKQGARHKQMICHRCNQEGHLAYRCRVDLSAVSDSSPLNWDESV